MFILLFNIIAGILLKLKLYIKNSMSTNTCACFIQHALQAIVIIFHQPLILSCKKTAVPQLSWMQDLYMRDSNIVKLRVLGIYIHVFTFFGAKLKKQIFKLYGNSIFCLGRIYPKQTKSTLFGQMRKMI